MVRTVIFNIRGDKIRQHLQVLQFMPPTSTSHKCDDAQKKFVELGLQFWVVYLECPWPWTILSVRGHMSWHKLEEVGFRHLCCCRLESTVISESIDHDSRSPFAPCTYRGLSRDLVSCPLATDCWKTSLTRPIGNFKNCFKWWSPILITRSTVIYCSHEFLHNILPDWLTFLGNWILRPVL